MYSNRVYTAKVDASHFFEGLVTEKVDKWFFSQNQCPLVYIGDGCVDVRRTPGTIRVRRVKYRYGFKQTQAKRRFWEPIMIAKRVI
jgi:hypothetical protein